MCSGVLCVSVFSHNSPNLYSTIMCGSPIISLWPGSAKHSVAVKYHIQTLVSMTVWRGRGCGSHRSGCLRSRWPRRCLAAYPEPGLNSVRTAGAGSGRRRDRREELWKRNDLKTRSIIEKQPRRERSDRKCVIRAGDWESSYLSSCPVLHLQFEWRMKALDVSECREIHLILVQLELHTTETHNNVQYSRNKKYHFHLFTLNKLLWLVKLLHRL